MPGKVHGDDIPVPHQALGRGKIDPMSIDNIEYPVGDNLCL